MSIHDSPGLRERRHRQTRIDIVDAAFELFAERGFGAVTMDEIARAAGVSRSTAYRRFPTKEDVVFDVSRRWLEAFDDAAASLPAGADLDAAISATTLAVSAHIDANLELAIAAYAVLEEAPQLNVSGVATSAWLRRLVDLVDRHGDLDREVAEVIAGAFLGGIDAMMFHWAATGGRESVVSSTERLLTLLRPILPPQTAARKS